MPAAVGVVIMRASRLTLEGGWDKQDVWTKEKEGRA
jgi:hypothetical protein